MVVACGVPWSIVALVLGVLALMVIVFAILTWGPWRVRFRVRWSPPEEDG